MSSASSLAALVSLSLAFAALLFTALAAGPASQPASQPASTSPALPPMRVFVAGHSFHTFVSTGLENLVHEAGIKNYETVGLSVIGGSTVLQHWQFRPKPPADAPANAQPADSDTNPLKDALRAGKIDVLTLSPIWLPDEGIEKFARFALAHNPNIRITVQEFWMPNDEYHPVYPLDATKKVDHDATHLAELRKAQEHYHKDLGDYVADINKRLGKQVLYTVPVGEAVLAIREKMAAGQAPQLGKQSDLFSDSWGHPKTTIKQLVAYCHFAVIFQRSPLEIPVSGDANAQATERLLQQAAWDAVTHDPLSGIKPAAASQP